MYRNGNKSTQRRSPSAWSVRGAKRAPSRQVELLATYVGRDPSARIMAGAVQGSDVRHLQAARLRAEVGGFCRMSDGASVGGVIVCLDYILCTVLVWSHMV